MVLPDANIFRSKTLRDWLFLLMQEVPGMFTVHYTDDILVEAMNTLRRANPTADGSLITRLREQIEKSSTSRLDGYPGDPNYPGMDPHDQHVHAAAKHHGINTVLTEDTGFHGIDPDLLPYEVSHCDAFFVLVDDAKPDAVVNVAAKQLRYWKARSGRPLPDALERSQCSQFADRVRGHMDESDLLRGIA